MKKFVLTICVVIICMVTALFYGKTGIKTTTGVHDPDIALSENTAMEIFYTGGGGADPCQTSMTVDKIWRCLPVLNKMDLRLPDEREVQGRNRRDNRIGVADARKYSKTSSGRRGALRTHH